MSKKLLVKLLVCILLGLVGCGQKEKTAPSKLPDIVFLNTIQYNETSLGNRPQYAIAFYDKNGIYYVSSDQTVCALDFDELVKEYAAGNLTDKIRAHISCDVLELTENYYKFYELSKDDFQIIYPIEGPDVIANVECWYGLYYDSEDNIQALKIHEQNAHGDHFADDERANEIYSWYINTFEK